MFYRLIILNRIKEPQERRRLLIFLFFDTIRNFIDIFANFAFLYPNYFEKDVVGLMGMTSALCWLTDFYKY